MRKLLQKTTVLTALTALVLTATAAATYVGSGVVDADSLRMRSQPSTSSATLTYLTDGTKVQVHEVLNDWYKVSYGMYTGYVHADYLDYTADTASADEKEEAVTIVEKEAVITGNDVNFRSGPSAEEKSLAVLKKDAKVTLVSVENDWGKVIWEKQTGYVSAKYLAVDGIPVVDARGIVTGDCVNVRSKPTTDSSIVTKVYAGTILELVSLEDNWYQINYKDNVCYISADYVDPYVPSSASSIGEKVVEEALSHLGTPYAWGGASPKGFDCSGFTMYVYGQFGYSLPHSATSQWNSLSTYVERADLQPGDMVFFCDPSRSNGKACSHAGIYIGDGKFVHASSGSSGKYVRISSLNESYYNRYYKGAKRIG